MQDVTDAIWHGRYDASNASPPAIGGDSPLIVEYRRNPSDRAYDRGVRTTANVLVPSPLPPGMPYTLRYASRAPGRNDPCACGSGIKFKRCHAKPSYPTIYDLNATEREAAVSLSRLLGDCTLSYRRSPFTFIVSGCAQDMKPVVWEGFTVEYTDGE